ncbi:MAG: hypothetical protein ACJ75H_18235 [Thermoanaerobaculia bacterium]
MRPRFSVLWVPLVLWVLASPAHAHVGSPNVFFDGDAGPYPVRVVVRPPAVVPGLAEVTVRLRDSGGKVDEVTTQPVQYQAGFKGAPPADVATPVPGAPGLWSSQLWLMVPSSYAVRVHVKGPAGEGEALVPVAAVPSRVLGMDRSLGIILAALGLFLFAGAVSIVGAAVRESVVPPGEAVDAARRSRARAVTVLAALLFALALWGGKRWWDSVDGRAREGLFKPFAVRTAVNQESGRPVLGLRIADERSGEWTPLIPDHGKLMHLFLIREPGLDAFAHLHPVPRGREDFAAPLPPLPAGTYRLYADVVHESGFPQTLVATVKIPAGAGAAAGVGLAPDPDDSWRASEPLGRAANAGPKLSLLEDGGSMLWHQEPLAAGREATLHFEVRGRDGRPASLEPYMGMLSHAVITRDDGEVFVHLHPMGSINMAAQQAFEVMEREEEGATPGMPGMDHGAHAKASAVSFPYEFPRPGQYRVWVQVKSGGMVLTGVFDTRVGG